MNDDHQPDVVFGESQSWYPNLSSHYIFDPNQDAQAEGRTAHPMDENMRFSNNIEIINDDEPFGIQDTQAHDMAILDNLNNIQSNPTNSAAATVSAEETQRRSDTFQTIIFATCSTSIHLPKHRTPMASNDDSAEEESTKYT